MAEPARSLPDDTAAFVEAVRGGIAAIDAGRTVPYEAVRRWLLSWSTTAEPPSFQGGPAVKLMESNRDAS